MNKAKLKAYAPNARKDFIQMIRQRADLLGLTRKEIETPEVSGEVAVIEGRPYPKRYAELHKRLAEKIKAEGLEPFIERIAYSWFNRFAALRFMEVGGFMSHGFRVLSNREAGKNEPEILTHAAEIELPGLDKARVLDLKLAGNKDAELYKMLLIAQCNELNRAMPFLFERINDETEILLPDNLLHSDSVIRKMVAAIDEADWAEVEIIGWLYQFYISEKKDEVIGKTVKSEDIPAATQLFTPNWIVKYMTQNSLGRLWLEANPHSSLASQMEFYIKPAETVHETHEKTLNKTEEESKNSFRDFGVIRGEKETVHEIHEKTLNRTEEESKNSFRDFSVISGQSSPEEIKVLDPACGSGHILVEAYELLKAIYTERGYSSRDIPLLILEKNLFGLDIDERAAQMANFALLMKARRDDRRIFEKINNKESIHEIHEKTLNKAENSFRDFSVIRGRIPNVLTIPDSSHLDARGIAEMFFSRDASSANAAVPIRDGNFLFGEMEAQPSLMIESKETVHERHEKTRNKSENSFSEISVFRGQSSSAEVVSEQNVIDLLELFEQGKTLGSLIRIPHGFGAVVDKLEKAVETKFLSGNFYEQVAARELEPFVRAGRMLTNKYDCVIANPPYMGGKGMNGELKAFAAKNFPDSKADLFAMFIERNFELLKPHGFNAMVTMHSWMFLSSYENFRENLLDNHTLLTLLHLPYDGKTPTAMGISFGISVFAAQKQRIKHYKASFSCSRYYELGEDGKPFVFPTKNERLCETDIEEFKKIPGSPVAYWVSDTVREGFVKFDLIKDLMDARTGVTTGDNIEFTRYWHEVSQKNIKWNCVSREESKNSKEKWYPLDCGGAYRKWYGNNDSIINWQFDGDAIRNFPGSTIRNEDYFFRKGMTWSKISSYALSVRFAEKGFMFDAVGLRGFSQENLAAPIIGFLNSKIAHDLVSVLNPTMSILVGDIIRLPLPRFQNSNNVVHTQIIDECISIARADWDSFETSWDFNRLPMLSNDELRITNYELKDGSNKVADEHLQLTDEVKQATDDLKHSTDEVKHLSDDPKQVTDEVKHLSDVPLQSSDEALQWADEPLQMADAPLHAAANAGSVEAAWNSWKRLCDWRINRMQQLETENNRLFIEAYGLADELSPEVPLSQITLMRADEKRDISRLLSYFVGCLMGRYSLDRTNLIYADSSGKGFEASNYQTFPADDDGIVPVTDMEWFEQDAARKFEDFIRVAFKESIHETHEKTLNKAEENSFRDFSVISGQKKEFIHETHEEIRNKTEENLVSFRVISGREKESVHETHEEARNRKEENKTEENLVSFRVVSAQSSSHEKNMRWIAEQLGGKQSETPIETIRRYFSTAFFKDHLQTYKKRPIYWLFSSGKQKAFECLVYLHRYNEATLPRMRHEFVLPLMSKLTAQIENLESLKDSAATTSERTKLEKQLETFRKKQLELAAFDEKLRHQSDLRINLDLDDGVKVNYGKFGDLLAEVKQVATTKE